jgi:hypothetical protein
MLERVFETMNEWELIGVLVGVAAIAFPLVLIVLQWLNRGAPMFEKPDPDDDLRPSRSLRRLRRRRRR